MSKIRKQKVFSAKTWFSTIKSVNGIPIKTLMQNTGKIEIKIAQAFFQRLKMSTRNTLQN